MTFVQRFNTTSKKMGVVKEHVIGNEGMEQLAAKIMRDLKERCPGTVWAEVDINVTIRSIEDLP